MAVPVQNHRRQGCTRFQRRRRALHASASVIACCESFTARLSCGNRPTNSSRKTARQLGSSTTIGSSSRTASCIASRMRVRRLRLSEEAPIVERTPAAELALRQFNAKPAASNTSLRPCDLRVEIIVEGVRPEQDWWPLDFAALRLVLKRRKVRGEARHAPPGRNTRRPLGQHGSGRGARGSAFTTPGMTRPAAPTNRSSRTHRPRADAAGPRSSARGTQPCTSPCRR